MRNPLRVLALVCIFLAAGCVPAHVRGPLQTLPEHARASARAIASPEYGREVEAAADSAALAATVLETVPEEARDRVHHEPALDGVAAVIAEVARRQNRELADPVVEQLVWHAGVAAEYLAHAPALASGSGAAAFLDAELRGIPWPDEGHIVFGVARLPGATSAQAMVFAFREVRVDSLSRSASAGEAQTLSGRLMSPYDDVTLLVDDGPTRIREVKVPVDADGRFSVTVPMPASAGRRMLEWTGIDENGWRASLLALPIWVDEPAPDDPAQDLASEVPNPESPADWPDVVRARVDAVRAEAGQAPMQAHPAADRLAAREAAAYARDPMSPSAPLLEALAADGMRTLDAQAYRGVTFNLDARITRAFERPSVRQMLLSPSMTRLSVAFAPQKDGGFADTWIVAEEPVAFDAGRLADVLSRDLNRRRGRNDVHALERDAALDALAKGWAERACAGDVDGANEFLETEARALRGFVIHGYQVLTSPILHPTLLAGAFGDPPTRQNLLSAQTHLGVAACERGAPGSPDNEWVVFMFADAVR